MQCQIKKDWILYCSFFILILFSLLVLKIFEMQVFLLLDSIFVAVGYCWLYTDCTEKVSLHSKYVSLLIRCSQTIGDQTWCSANNFHFRKSFAYKFRLFLFFQTITDIGYIYCLLDVNKPDAALYIKWKNAISLRFGLRMILLINWWQSLIHFICSHFLCMKEISDFSECKTISNSVYSYMNTRIRVSYRKVNYFG